MCEVSQRNNILWSANHYDCMNCVPDSPRSPFGSFLQPCVSKC